MYPQYDEDNQLLSEEITRLVNKVTELDKQIIDGKRAFLNYKHKVELAEKFRIISEAPNRAHAHYLNFWKNPIDYLFLAIISYGIGKFIEALFSLKITFL